MTLKATIGIEIEGFIPINKYDKIREYCRLKNIDFGSDGSVHNNRMDIPEPNTITHQELLSYYAFEIRGMGLVYDIENKTEFFKMIKKLFDFGIKVNSSCGLHFHISFKQKSNFFKILSYNFINSFQENIKKILINDYEKLRFSNDYCKPYKDKKDFIRATTQQVYCLNKDCSRYQSINFNSYNIHKTIEFRILPATSKILKFKKYINFILKEIEDFLNTKKEILFNINYQKEINTTPEPEITITIKKQSQSQRASEPESIRASEPESIRASEPESIRASEPESNNNTTLNLNQNQSITEPESQSQRYYRALRESQRTSENTEVNN
jgi:hypothetical protein